MTLSVMYRIGKISKLIIIFCTIFLIINLIGCRSSQIISPVISPTSPTSTSTVSPTQTPFTQGFPVSIPIGIGVYDEGDVEIFNKYASEQDVIAFRSQYINYLNDVRIGHKMLVLSPADEPLDNFNALISEALPYGISSLGYNLETALPIEELVSKEKEVAQVAHNANLLYVFGPTLAKLLRYYSDFAQYADVIQFQAQRYQTDDNFESEVENLIDDIKSINPKVKVWVQVSVNPPENREIEAQVVIQQIMSIADKADLVWIYFTPAKVNILEEVLKGIRQPKIGTSTVNPTQVVSVTSAPLTGYLCGYWTFTRPSELPLSDLQTYTNIIYYPQDSENDYPDEADLSALREHDIKLVIKLDKRIVEDTFDQVALEKLKTRLDQYRDVIYAVWPIDEPYKEGREKQYTFEQLKQLIQNIKGIFPDYKIWVNFLTPTIIISQQGNYPGIPDNIDIVSTDIYLHSTGLTEDKYRKFIGENLDLIKKFAGARPVLFAGRSFSIAGDKGTPLYPDQVNWDADMVRQYKLIGLAWYFYDDTTPGGNGYGASHFPDVIARQREIGAELIGEESPINITSTQSVDNTATLVIPLRTQVPQEGEIIQLPIVVAIEQETNNKYPDIQGQIDTAVAYVNQLLSSADIQKQFYVDHFADVYDKNIPTNCKARDESAGYLPGEYCSHPGNYAFVVVDETNSKNYPFREGPSVEWHGVKEFQAGPPDTPHQQFSQESLHVLAHELGHILGLPDLYLLRVAAEDNQVNQQAFPNETYDPFADDIMNGGTFGKFSLWDKEIIDRENPSFPAKYNTWYDYQPQDTILEIVGKNGQPLPQVELRIFSHARTPAHKQVIDGIPEYNGQTDAQGRFSMGENILDLDRNDAVKVFLVEIKYNGQVDYQWFNFMDVNFAYWSHRTVRIVANIID